MQHSQLPHQRTVQKDTLPTERSFPRACRAAKDTAKALPTNAFALGNQKKSAGQADNSDSQSPVPETETVEQAEAAQQASHAKAYAKACVAGQSQGQSRKASEASPAEGQAFATKSQSASSFKKTEASLTHQALCQKPFSSPTDLQSVLTAPLSSQSQAQNLKMREMAASGKHGGLTAINQNNLGKSAATYSSFRNGLNFSTPDSFPTSKRGTLASIVPFDALPLRHTDTSKAGLGNPEKVETQKILVDAALQNNSESVSTAKKRTQIGEPRPIATQSGILRNVGITSAELSANHFKSQSTTNERERATILSTSRFLARADTSPSVQPFLICPTSSSDEIAHQNQSLQQITSCLTLQAHATSVSSGNIQPRVDMPVRKSLQTVQNLSLLGKRQVPVQNALSIYEKLQPLSSIAGLVLESKQAADMSQVDAGLVRTAKLKFGAPSQIQILRRSTRRDQSDVQFNHQSVIPQLGHSLSYGSQATDKTKLGLIAMQKLCSRGAFRNISSAASLVSLSPVNTEKPLVNQSKPFQTSHQPSEVSFGGEDQSNPDEVSFNSQDNEKSLTIRKSQLGINYIDRDEGVKECQMQECLIQNAIDFLEKPDFYEQISRQKSKAVNQDGRPAGFDEPKNSSQMMLTVHTQPSSGSREKEAANSQETAKKSLAKKQSVAPIDEEQPLSQPSLQAVQKKEISSESSVGKLTPPYSPQVLATTDHRLSKSNDEQPQSSLRADPRIGDEGECEESSILQQQVQSMPVFDKNIDYMKLMMRENLKLDELKARYEQEQSNVLGVLKCVLTAQVNLDNESKMAQYRLRKREQKYEDFIKQKMTQSGTLSLRGVEKLRERSEKASVETDRLLSDSSMAEQAKLMPQENVAAGSMIHNFGKTSFSQLRSQRHQLAPIAAQSSFGVTLPEPQSGSLSAGLLRQHGAIRKSFSSLPQGGYASMQYQKAALGQDKVNQLQDPRALPIGNQFLHGEHNSTVGAMELSLGERRLPVGAGGIEQGMPVQSSDILNIKHAPFKGVERFFKYSVHPQYSHQSNRADQALNPILQDRAADYIALQEYQYATQRHQTLSFLRDRNRQDHQVIHRATDSLSRSHQAVDPFQGDFSQAAKNSNLTILNQESRKPMSLQAYKELASGSQVLRQTSFQDNVSSYRAASVMVQSPINQSGLPIESSISSGNCSGGNKAKLSRGVRQSGKNGPRKQPTVRRTANQIKKEFKCPFCAKTYGSEPATIMHMRNKHEAGTKQEIERDFGICLRDNLLRDSAQSDLEMNKTLLKQIQHPTKLKEKLNISDQVPEVNGPVVQAFNFDSMGQSTSKVSSTAQSQDQKQTSKPAAGSQSQNASVDQEKSEAQ